ncbi:MAG: hypothetical protein ACUVWV_07825 [Thermodesulfobacteriota bacterium]
MFKHYGFLNFLLSIIIIFLFIKNYETWTKPKPGPIIKEESKRSESKGDATPLLSNLNIPKFDVSSLPALAQKNIFHPERKDFVSINPEQPKTMLLNRPQLQLQGILITDEVMKASLILEGRSLPKGEKAVRTLNLGDQIGEYKLTKILPDRIVLEGPGDVYEVFLYDLKSPKKRMEIRTTPRRTEPIRSSPAGPVPTTKTSPPLPQALQPSVGITRETRSPAYQPPLPQGSPVPPGPFLPPPRTPPLPEEATGGKN